MSTTTLDSTAVVTVSYNSSAEFESFLASVEASESRKVPVIIADNLSDDLDATRRIAAAHGAIVVPLPDNRGYGGAINAAVATLPPEIEFILISNPDVRVHAGAISVLVASMRAQPTTGAVGPQVLNADGSPYPSARQIPSLRTGVGHSLFMRVWPGNPWSRAYRSEKEPIDSSRRVGWLSGSCVLVRRAAFTAVGGFDDDFFMYFEDVDLGYRLGKSGWFNVYEPQAVVTHTGAHSTNSDSRRMLRAHHESAYRFLSHKYRGWYLAPLRWVLHLGLSTRAWWLTRG